MARKKQNYVAATVLTVRGEDGDRTVLPGEPVDDLSEERKEILLDAGAIVPVGDYENEEA